MLSNRVYLLHLPAIALSLMLTPVWSPAQQTVVSATKPAPALVLNQLGKGTAVLDGPWQFHVGDNPAWAEPGLDDSTGQGGWEQLTADQPWGLQGHESYAGYAWYRRHITISPAEGASPDVALMIPAIDDVYEIYWNGVPVGHLGSFPPHVDFYSFLAPQTYGLGPVRSGVLAMRVFKVALVSNDDGTAGGFEAPPVIGSPEAIASVKGADDFRWLRKQQFRFCLTCLYGLTALLSLFAWLRDRKERLLFWMAVYTSMPLLEIFLNGLRMPISMIWLTFAIQTSIQVREISQWFLLLWLLQLNEFPRLVRWTRIAAYISLAAGFLDGAMGFLYLSPLSERAFQIADAFLTFFILPSEVIPAVMVVYAIVRRRKLDSARWTVAIVATVNALFYSIQNISVQGVRFTHWTFANKMTTPLFTLFGSVFPAQAILRTLLFMAIVYAVLRYSIENRRRQTALEQEFQNARELQQVLVPENLPPLPGFALTSAYRPAAEVGGDFFQIIPLDGGSTLVILGDVSGKGLKAAMAVSLIVGATRMIVEYTTSPAEILEGLNRRLFGRMQGGFATAIAMCLNSDGTCVMATAGHPSPFLNQQEMSLPGSLPLGLMADSSYEESSHQLGVGDHCALYTDGLLEARSQTGELYGFARLEMLFATRPNAAQATEAAVNFGQDDDITVLTLTRLATGEESSAIHSTLALSPA
jgi:hypothetical protein